MSAPRENWAYRPPRSASRSAIWKGVSGQAAVHPSEQPHCPDRCRPCNLRRHDRGAAGDIRGDRADADRNRALATRHQCPAVGRAVLACAPPLGFHSARAVVSLCPARRRRPCRFRAVRHRPARICYGPNPYPDLVAVLLCHDAVLPVCSPDYLIRNPDAADPGLEGVPDEDLIHTDWGAQASGSLPTWEMSFARSSLSRTGRARALLLERRHSPSISRAMGLALRLGSA